MQVAGRRVGDGRVAANKAPADRVPLLAAVKPGAGRLAIPRAFFLVDLANRDSLFRRQVHHILASLRKSSSNGNNVDPSGRAASLKIRTTREKRDFG
jgi:hypothetical protein